MKRSVIIGLTLVLFGSGCLSMPVFQVNAPEPTPTGQPTEAVTVPNAATTTAPAQPANVPQPAKPKATAPKPSLQPNQETPTTGPVHVYVTISDTGFSPQVIAINAGDTVVWTNRGTQNHTVASDGALLYDSGNIRPGTSWSRVFPAAGSYGYHDGAHPTLKGTVTVH